MSNLGKQFPVIKEVENANYIMGTKFKFPHEVARHEDALQSKGLMETNDRMTCSSCRGFRDRAHIKRHSDPQPTLM